MSDKPVSLIERPEGHTSWLTDLKIRIHAAQQRVILTINHELVTLYWQIGCDILTRQAKQGWAARSSTDSPMTCDRLSRDEGIFPLQPDVHASLCRSLGRP